MALTLSKSGDSHKLSLAKGANASIHVNLKWSQRTVKKSGGIIPKWLGGSGGGDTTEGADLDLGCMYEMADGSKSVIQALGEAFGSKTSAPFILLDKDDRSGASSDGENLDVFRADLVKRVLIFAYVYDRSTDFAAVAARVTMKASNGEEVEVVLDNPTAGRTFAAIAMITNEGGQLVIRKEEQYFGGHIECDRHYGFNFEWHQGSK